LKLFGISTADPQQLEVRWRKASMQTPVSRFVDLKSVLILIAVGIGVYLFAFPAPLTDGDTLLYAEIARNMVDSGDWIVLRSERMSIVDKPPLSIWPIAASFSVFGESPLTTRAWHIAVALGCVVLTYLIAREYYDRKTSMLSAMVLLSSILFYYMGFVPQQDIPGLFLICLGILFLIRTMRRRSLASFYGIFVTLGLGLLNRGLSGLVVPAGIILACFLATYRRGARLNLPFSTRSGWVLHTALGIAVTAAVACPWYAAAYARQGRELIDVLLLSGNVRFMHDPAAQHLAVIRQILEWLSYIPLLIVGFLPWSALLWPSIRDCVARIKKERSSSDTLIVTWAVVGLLFAFAIRWRVIRYLIPVFPPLSIMVARYIASLLEGDPFRRRTERPTDDARPANPLRKVAILDLAIVVPVFLLAVAYVFVQFTQEIPDYLPIVLPILLSVGLSQIAFGVLALARKLRAAVYSLPLISITGLIIAMLLLPVYWKQL